MAVRTVEYHAISIFSSRTFWVNFVAAAVAVLSLTEIVTLIPATWMSAYTAVIAVLNITLRMFTVRPAVMIMPGETQAVTVKKLHEPTAKKPTD